jgi:hypothetical protein
MIDYGSPVAHERKTLTLHSAGRIALAGVLALILLVAGTLSVSHGLHEALHHEGDTPHHLCLLCSLAKGQVEAALLPCVCAGMALCPILTSGLATTIFPADFRYCLSQSRAPPNR